MKKQLFYQFDLDIERVYLLINMKCSVQVWWKSGKGKISTKNAIKLQGTETYFDINEKLSITAKLVMENGVFREKKTELLIILFTTENTSKLGGRVYFNLSDFINRDDPMKTTLTQKRVETKLESCPDEASRVVFNFGFRYVEDNEGYRSHDVSFQATNPGSSMTFRTPGNYSCEQNGHNQSAYREKSRESKERFRESSSTYLVADQPNKSGSKSDKLLEFSFNPSQSEKQIMGVDNSELIKDLKLLVQEKTSKIKSLEAENEAIRQQRNRGDSSRSLSLINDLNSAIAQREQMQADKIEQQRQSEALRGDLRNMESSFTRYKSQKQAQLTDLNNKLVLSKQTIEDLNLKLELSAQKCAKLQDELFRKENDLIDKDKQIEGNHRKSDITIKEQAEQLKLISIALEKFKTDYEAVKGEQQSEKKKNGQLSQRIRQYEEQRRSLLEQMERMGRDFQVEKESANNKYQLLEKQFKEREVVIEQLDVEFTHISSDGKRRDEEVSVLREKFNASCRKIDELSQREDSYRNQVSSLNVRINTLEKICQEHEKSIEEKDELIEKAKEYVRTKEKEMEERDQYLAKARNYIQSREESLTNEKRASEGEVARLRQSLQEREGELARLKQGLQERQNVQEMEGELIRLKQSLQQRERALGGYIHDLHQRDRQIEDMDRYIGSLKQQTMKDEDEIAQLLRKLASHQDDLKQLVSKNLDMQIQINVKNYQINSLKGLK